jgi:hypothetical protein
LLLIFVEDEKIGKYPLFIMENVPVLHYKKYFFFVEKRAQLFYSLSVSLVDSIQTKQLLRIGFSG